MKIFLIDTENVGCHWATQCKIDKRDKVCLFYSVNSGNISEESLNIIAQALKGETITQNKCQYGDLSYVLVNNTIDFETIDCLVGHNAMDFQLVSYLGMLVVENPDAEFIIVSDDHGYDAVVSMWNKKGIYVRRLSVSRQAVRKKNKEEKKKNKEQISKDIIIALKNKKPEVRNIVADILINENEETIEQTTNLFIKHYINNRENFCHVLKSVYGKDKGKSLNKRIKKNASKIMNLAS